MKPQWLIVGLGNPGDEYNHTRHNIGFDVLDRLAQLYQGIFTTKKLADIADITWKGYQFICIKPNTFMNLSGKAVRYWTQETNTPLSNTLIIVDDLAIPLSKLRLRPGGSDAGHNGLKSIQEYLETTEYPKLRFGIGNHFSRGKQVDFVLSKWTQAEESIVSKKIDKSIDIIFQIATIGLSKAMSNCNAWDAITT